MDFSSIAQKFVEGVSHAQLPAEQFISESNEAAGIAPPKRRTLTELTPSMKPSEVEVEHEAAVTPPPLFTAQSSPAQSSPGPFPNGVIPSFTRMQSRKAAADAKSSASVPVIIDRLSLFSLKLENEKMADVPHHSLEAKLAYNRVFFQSPSEARTESDCHTYDESIFFSSQACQMLTWGARFLIAKTAQLVTLEDEQVLVSSGSHRNCVYWVIHGELEVTASDGSVRILSEGSSLGVLPDMPSFDPLTPRTRQSLHVVASTPTLWEDTARARGQADLVSLDFTQWSNICSLDPFTDARKVSSFLLDLPMFAILSSEEAHQLARIIRCLQIPPGSIIFQQESEGDAVFLIKSGFVRVVRDVLIEDADRLRINKLTKKCADLDCDINSNMSPRSKVIGSKHKKPPAYLERVPPSPLINQHGLGEVHISGSQTHRPMGSSERINARIDQVDGRSSLKVGSASLKLLGGEAMDLPPLDFSRLHKDSHKHTQGIQPDNKINNQTLYSPRTPRSMDKNDSGKTMVELASIGPGRVFGDVRSYGLELPPRAIGSSGSAPIHIRQVSAVADTTVQAFQICRCDASKVGGAIDFLWIPEVEAPPSVKDAAKSLLKPKTISSLLERKGQSFALPALKPKKQDTAVRNDYESKLQWGLYKKKLLAQIYGDALNEKKRQRGEGFR